MTATVSADEQFTFFVRYLSRTVAGFPRPSGVVHGGEKGKKGQLNDTTVREIILSVLHDDDDSPWPAAIRPRARSLRIFDDIGKTTRNDAAGTRRNGGTHSRRRSVENSFPGFCLSLGLPIETVYGVIHCPGGERTRYGSSNLPWQSIGIIARASTGRMFSCVPQTNKSGRKSNRSYRFSG